MTKVEEIARKWDVYYLASGEVNKDVLEALNEALRIHDVVGQSEQLPQKSEHCVSISPEPCKYKGVCKICS